jgi:hypothetical protein
MGVSAVLETRKVVAGKETKDGGLLGEVITVVASNFLASVPLGLFIISGMLFIDILNRDWLQWSCKIQNGVQTAFHFTLPVRFLRIRY